MSPAKKEAFVDLVEPRVLDRVGDGALDDLDADDLARAARQRQPDRADAAVEVVDALVAAQPGHLDRDAVELLGHLGVGLEERLGGDQELEVAEALAQLRRAGEQLRLAALRALAEARGLGPEQARRSGPRRSARRRPACPGEVTRRTWNSPVRRPSRTTRLRRKPRCSRRSQAPRPWRAALGERRLAQLVAALGGELAVGHREDPVEAAGGVEAAHELARRRRSRTSTRACCGSATARRRGRSARARSPRAARCGSAPPRPARP